MTSKEVMQQLEKMADAQTKKTLVRHGANEPFFGVKIADMKQAIQKKVKKDYQLSKDLYDTGNGDAQYLAGLIADETKMTKKDLDKWVKNANWQMISEYTVGWIAAESAHGWELGREWIDSKKDSIASSGWSTLAGVVTLRSDDQLELGQIEKLLARVEKDIDHAGNRTKYCMNNFVTAVGCYVIPLNQKAKATGKKISGVTVDMGDTACKLPEATAYIDKVEKAGKLGKKKKELRC